ncbi:MAG TPA: thioredoxin domain-containing protein [Dehalococcoidia bacterium]|nr:thioredoxin domain-containing protein [Dehalococcoidia bacterium]
MANRLANETSPYLLQHADNPVDWYAWGEEAFAAARAANKPILLSVGYSACHWCHVMAHESFENETIARQMNESFINIKVDREERPDVDAIYMQAVQALTGRGGWPMTVFLKPDGVPFFGGTYFPPEDRGGMRGFPFVLSAVLEAYRERPGDIDRAGEALLLQLDAPARVRPGDRLLTTEVLDAAAEALLAAHDPIHGGFGGAPKFPQAMVLAFLMRHYHRTNRPSVLEAVRRSLDSMARGGMYDQVGGGFHRYSTDAVWLVPHFEKMLYDNALLASCYLDAYKLTGDAFYKGIVTQTLDYVLREMTDPAGGFYSSQDADSEGEEGRFFVWTPAELEATLGADAEAVARYYGVTQGGNFEGANILNVPKPENEPPGLDAARAKLYETRERRVHPARDDKVLTAWNGLMLRAFAEAALALDEPRYREAAIRNADFLLGAMRPEGRLLRTWKGGTAHLIAYLEDYACLADGLLALYEATFEARYLTTAAQLAEEMIDLFWDDEAQGFFDTGRDHEALIIRPRDFWDNATPSGNSVAADVLLHLAALLDKPDYETRATTYLRALAPVVEQAATGFGRFLCALDFHLDRDHELAIVWPSGSPLPAGEGQGEGSAAPLLDTVRSRYTPNLLLFGGPSDDPAPPTPLLADKTALNGNAAAYLCERHVCQAPTTDPSELTRQLDEAGV